MVHYSTNYHSMKNLLSVFVSVLIITSSQAQTDSLSSNRDTLVYFTLLDTTLVKYQLPSAFEKPENWKKKLSAGEWYPGEFSDTMQLAEALDLIDNSDEFWSVCQAKSWCVKNYQRAFPYLVSRLSVKEKVGLTNTADLIIWCRLGTKDLRFYGHGGSISEDLFTVSGRASWILNEITGESFASVQCDMSEEESIEYKAQWVEYIRQLK